MARFLKKRDLKLAGSPGSLVFVGSKKIERSFLRVIEYNPDIIKEMEGRQVGDIPELRSETTVSWLSVYGLHDTALTAEIGSLFKVHALVLEDILNTDQRPKLEAHDDYLFLVLKLIRFNKKELCINSDQLSILVSDNYLITFQEKPIDLFEPLREKLRKQKNRLRDSGVDYLAYAILDVVIDNYMATIEEIGSQIEDLEDLVLDSPAPEILDKITTYKHEVNYLRKSIRPARELVLRLQRLDSTQISPHTAPFLGDLYDHITQATEALDSYREMLSDHLHIYHSNISVKLSDIMKVLTIFAAIFIPLTFIAGVYGTNFEFFPELKYKYSYFVFWLVNIGVAATMLVFFKKKGWL